MKSAYELAMERLEKDDPSSGKTLSDEQKSRLEELSRAFKTKVAEREVFLRGKIAAAQAKGDRGEVESLERELREERARLEEECEAEKEKVRHG